MIGLYAFLVLFVGVPLLVYLSDRRRRRRTQAELEDDAVRTARDGGLSVDSNLPAVGPPVGPLQ